MKPVLDQFKAVLPKADLIALKNAADKAESLETKWQKKIQKEFDKAKKKAVPDLKKGRVPNIDFEDIYIAHSLEVMKESYQTAKKTKVQFSKPPKGWVPRTTKDIKRAFEIWKSGKIPKTGKWGEFFKRQKSMANDVKKRYNRRIKQIWGKYSEDFRKGNTFTQEKAVQKIQEAFDVSSRDAKAIVNTETTHYYNKVRREYYDESPDVTHYLFVAIRDRATTKWCKSRNGLVYEKGTEALDVETPPIHWNCRSEILPLTLQNPKHRALIKDKSKQRSRKRPAPLHPKWLA